MAFSFTSMPKGFLPQDQGYLFASVLPEAASLERAEAVMAQARKLLMANPAVEDVIQVSGSTFSTAPAPLTAGFISVMLRTGISGRRWMEVMADIQRQLLSLPDGDHDLRRRPCRAWAMPRFDLRILAPAGQSSAELERGDAGDPPAGEPAPQLSRVFPPGAATCRS